MIIKVICLVYQKATLIELTLSLAQTSKQMITLISCYIYL